MRRSGGVGAALKLVLNTALVTAVTALADVVGGRAVALEALAAGPLGSAINRATTTGASFSVTLTGKDLDLAPQEFGPTPAPIAHAAAQALRRCIRSILRHCHTRIQGVFMRLTLDNPATVSAPFGDRFAHVARLDLAGGALLVLSGQVAVDDAGEVVAPGDITAQSERVFELIGGILAGHGATFANVLHIRTFMTNLDDLPGYGQVRRRFFPRTPPASTTVQVSRLFLAGAVLEVEVTAAIRTEAAGA